MLSVMNDYKFAVFLTVIMQSVLARSPYMISTTVLTKKDERVNL